jgi:hypothetical protein
LVTFFACMNALLLSNGRLKSIYTINLIMTIAALLMFTVATVDVGVVLNHDIKMFVDEDPNAIPSLVGLRSTWWTEAQIATLLIQTFLGDAILASHMYSLPIQKSYGGSATRYTGVLWSGIEGG